MASDGKEVPRDGAEGRAAEPPEDERRWRPTRRELLVTGLGAGAAASLSPVGAAVPAGAAATPAAGGPAATALDLVLHVNGARHPLRLDPRTTLLDALREHL